MSQPVYYPISALTRDHYAVLFPLGPLVLKSGEILQVRDIQGFRKTYRKGQANERIVYRVRRPDGTSEDLPRHMAPTLFRPANLRQYPDPLPPPASLTAEHIAWGSEHPPRNMTPDDPSPLDWIGAYNLPGAISKQEAEIRVLRALKTERARGVDDKGLAGPKAFGSILDGMLGRAVTVAAWVPDKRDIGDWVIALGWLNRIDDTCAKVIVLKSLEFSFRQIAEQHLKHLKKGREWMREKYHQGIEQVTKMANKGARR